jgi:hypothetical protein
MIDDFEDRLQKFLRDTKENIEETKRRQSFERPGQRKRRKRYEAEKKRMERKLNKKRGRR